MWKIFYQFSFYFMKQYISYWYKDFFSRFSLLFTWLVFLFILNYPWIYYVFNKRLPSFFNIWLYLIAIIFFGFILFSMLRFYRLLRYDFSKQGIKIILPSGKEFMLEKNSIDKIEKINRIPWRYWSGIRYKYFKQEILFTTSTSNILKIYMKDGRKILISPRTIKQELLNLYK